MEMLGERSLARERSIVDMRPFLYRRPRSTMTLPRALTGCGRWEAGRGVGCSDRYCPGSLAEPMRSVVSTCSGRASRFRDEQPAVAVSAVLGAAGLTTGGTARNSAVARYRGGGSAPPGRGDPRISGLYVAATGQLPRFRPTRTVGLFLTGSGDDLRGVRGARSWGRPSGIGAANATVTPRFVQACSRGANAPANLDTLDANGPR